MPAEFNTPPYNSVSHGNVSLHDSRGQINLDTSAYSKSQPGLSANIRLDTNANNNRNRESPVVNTAPPVVLDQHTFGELGLHGNTDNLSPLEGSPNEDEFLEFSEAPRPTDPELDLA